MRVAIHGDWHGNTGFAVGAISRDRLGGANHIIQLGDFGFWPGHRGELYLSALEDALAQVDLPLYWIAGNHDWWDEIDVMVETHGWENPIEMSPHIFYLPNGCKFEIAGKKFGVLGGAFSVDWEMRTPHVSWWPQECPTYLDVQRLADEKLDVLLTHDGPDELQSSWVLGPTDQAKANGVRQIIRNAIYRTRPKTLYHGHWHIRWSGSFDYCSEVANDKIEFLSCMVHSLGADRNPSEENVRLVDINYV